MQSPKESKKYWFASVCQYGGKNVWVPLTWQGWTLFAGWIFTVGVLMGTAGTHAFAIPVGIRLSLFFAGILVSLGFLILCHKKSA